jgi:histidine kinase/DNA gyrase B/HSP90-like ATPase
MSACGKFTSDALLFVHRIRLRTTQNKPRPMSANDPKRTFHIWFPFDLSLSVLRSMRALSGATTKPAGEGTGLGLSISHDIIVKQHGGSIEVDTQPGEFTEIRIILPRAGVSL